MLRYAGNNSSNATGLCISIYHARTRQHGMCGNLQLIGLRRLLSGRQKWKNAIYDFPTWLALLICDSELDRIILHGSE